VTGRREYVKYIAHPVLMYQEVVNPPIDVTRRQKQYMVLRAKAGNKHLY
jgi:hypothetical protein